MSTEFARLCTPSAEVQSDSVAEQVAQISDVAAGKIDGDAFFRRNHFTEGLGRLVSTGFERLAGKSDSGAFYLTQAMGGGKTHSLITMALLASDPGLRQRVVPEIAAKHPFERAKVIAFDGHNSPSNFLWGNIADQLGRPEAMQRFWANGPSAPGVDDWVATIGTDEPVLILLDELPSYLQMATGQTVASSTLADQTVIALERLFNALPKLPKVCVIVTNLKDDVYQDGAGKLKAAIDGLSKHYDRNATAITPVQQNTGEVFEIVRKRLFDKLPDAVTIETIGQAYVDALEAAKRVDTLPVVPETYLARIRETYPFHPSIRDVAARFSENRGYQKTRALIRLMRHAVRGALKSEEPVFLIGLQHLDLNDQATLEEVRKINASFTNAISRDIADRGNATAEKIDAADGKLQATSVSKLLLMSSLSTAENPTRGLREGELYEALIDPLVKVSDLKPALEKLQGQAWYLQRDTQERIYVSQTQNVTAEINEIASAIANEMVDETLRTKLGEVFRPVHGDVYDSNITILPGGDELSVPDDRVRLVEQATKQWLSLPKSERDQTMIFASGRRLRDAVNTSVQEGLLKRGELGQQGLQLQVLDRVNLTNEELRYSHHYLPGRVLELGRPIREQRLGAGRYRVTEVDQNGRVQLRDEHGKAYRFAPDRMRPDAKGASGNRLALYDQKQRTIYAGDQIRWTANDHERGLLNADRAKVAAIDKRQVQVETSAGMKLALSVHDPMLARIDLAYAYNAHMAQGMTADRAIVVMESRDTKLLTRQNFLVSVTRVRDDLTIFVDKADKAKAKLELQSGEKTSSLETVGEIVKQPPELEKAPVKPFEFGIG